MPLDTAKLAKLKAQNVSRLGGKGTPRRKVIKKTAVSGAGNDQKLQGALKKLNLQPITAVEEVNMFQDDGNVLHFQAPKVHAALPSNTMAVYGAGQTKELTDLVPGILGQLGPDSLASLRKLAAQYQSQTAAAAAAAAAAAGANGAGDGEPKADGEEDDDDVPDLVETFEPTDDAPKPEEAAAEGKEEEKEEEKKEEAKEEVKEEAKEEEKGKDLDELN